MLIRLIFVYAYRRPTHVIGQHTFAPGWRERLITGHHWESFHILQFASIMPVLWIHEKLS